MPRFFFDVREGASFLDDEEGLEFDTFDAAEREAAIAVASIARDRLLKGDTRDVTIEMLNEHRQRVLTITIRMEVDRVEPPPVPPSRT